MQVVVLRSLRSKLAEAQAQIHTTAAALHLRDTQHSHEQHASHVGLNEREHLFQQACRAVTNTCNSCSEVCPSCLCQSHMQLGWLSAVTGILWRMQLLPYGLFLCAAWPFADTSQHMQCVWCVLSHNVSKCCVARVTDALRQLLSFFLVWAAMHASARLQCSLASH